MFQTLTRKFRKPPLAHVLPLVPENQRIYCVGDIHGRADLLVRLHEKIQKDAQGYKGAKTIVYLGDYVDRGDQSRQVIDILLSNPLDGFEAVYLKGNHEQAMLDFIEYPDAAAAWLSFGGREALNSYGIPLAYIPSADKLKEIAQQLDQNLPDSHRDFMLSLEYSWECGNYTFVHAGIRPGVPLEQQNPEDLLWIRDDFLGYSSSYGTIVVHGHSVVKLPEFLPNRIGIDTGAYSTGVLTCLILEGEQQRILQTGGVNA